MKFLGRFFKAVGLLVVVWVAVSMGVVLYMPYHSSKVAHAFCDSVSINDELASLDKRAKDGHINQTSTNDGGIEEHQFWVYGMFESMSMCKVVVSKGKILSKHVVDD